MYCFYARCINNDIFFIARYIALCGTVVHEDRPKGVLLSSLAPFLMESKNRQSKQMVRLDLFLGVAEAMKTAFSF